MQEDIRVTKEDQDRINVFARHSGKVKEYKSELKERKKELENLEELEAELMMLEDGINSVPYLIGDSFIYISPEGCQSKIESETVEIRARMAKLEDLMSKSTVDMNLLKKDLYSKFKENINLEEDP